MVIRLHRIGHWLWERHVPLLPKMIKVVNRVVFGVVLPSQVKVGPGVLLSYQGLGTVIHRGVVIGAGAVISTGVTLGGRGGREGAPQIGERALIGTGAKVLGPVRIGKCASVGANAVVLNDVPDFAVVVGIPARVVRVNRPEDIPDYHDY